MRQQTVTMQDAMNTAKMLSEALPYLQRYSGAVVVVKFGGNAWGMMPLWPNLPATSC